MKVQAPPHPAFDPRKQGSKLMSQEKQGEGARGGPQGLAGTAGAAGAVERTERRWTEPPVFIIPLYPL